MVFRGYALFPHMTVERNVAFPLRARGLREFATTFVFVTHDQAEALSMSSRVAIFNQGRLIQGMRIVAEPGHPMGIRVRQHPSAA
jgi:ABC-type Fe3+/spermidine/putrescine transport system ATPase subunit